MEFDRLIKSTVNEFDEELKKYIPKKNNAQKGIYDAMNYSLFAGGKRLRPVIMFFTAQMCGIAKEAVMPFACALEMIHTYSLIHDDLPAMDDDNLRRGKPTNHIVYGQAMAILAGDALLNKAIETALTSTLDDDIILKVVRILFEASGTEGMIGGQVIDIKNSTMTAAELENLHLLKTGALIRAAGVIGAVAARADADKIKAVDDFCKNLGIAFQIRDDILDVKGNEAVLGKPIGSDKDNNKTTYVTLFGLDEAEKKAEKYTKKAKEALYNCFGNKSDNLISLADYLMTRLY